MIEYKYKIEDNRLVNRANGVPLPEDEPLFILRAQDKKALQTLMAYSMVCDNLDHTAQVKESVDAFRKFAAENPDRMKEPD